MRYSRAYSAGFLVVALAGAAALCWPHPVAPPPEPSESSSGSTAPRPPTTIASPAIALPDSAFPGALGEPALVEFVDHRRDTSARVANLATRVPQLRDTQQRELVRSVLLDRGEADIVRHEAANLLRRSHDPGLVDALAAIVADGRETVRLRAYASQHLGVLFDEGNAASGGSTLRQRLVGLLDQAQPTAVRREALLALVRARDPEACAWVRAGLASPAYADMRDCVIDCLIELNARDLVDEVRRVAGDDQGVPDTVRIAAIAALGSWQDGASRSIFVWASNQKDECLRDAGILALRRLDQGR